MGAVGANDMLNLKKALREHPTISTIVLQNNGGGLVHIGLVVAEEIYERGLNTYIPKDSYCASACSFVFFAGRQRLAVGRLGVHQISAPELTGEQAQFGVSDIVATLPKYGVSADVLGIMFSTPSGHVLLHAAGNRQVRHQPRGPDPGVRQWRAAGRGQRAAPALAPAPQQQTSAPAPAPQQQTSAPAGEAKLPRASRLPPARRRSPIRT